jgi:hypothetical protein
VKKNANKNAPAMRATRQAHDTSPDGNTSASYWSKRPLAYIVDQLRQHHGVKITADQLKGPNKVYTKGDLLVMIKKKLEIT